MRYLDPKNDLTFRKVFGQHPHLLRSFLNALIPLAENQQIVSLEYLPTELVPDIPALKHSIVDVRCTDNFDRQFIVEMQMLWTDSFKRRILFNASKAYVKQLEKGNEYKSLNPVYALSLVNEDFEKDTDVFYHHYSIVHNLLNDKKLEGLEFVFVELPKFKAQNLTDKKMQVLWLQYLAEKEKETDQLPEDLTSVPEIREALELLRESSYTRDELEVYDKYWDGISSEKTLMEGALRQGRQLGLQEGKEMGLQEGKELGIQEGKELGIQEGKEMGLQEGKELGIQEGKELGIQEGKEMGIQEGKEMGIQEGKELGIQEGKEMGIQEGKEMGIQAGIEKAKRLGIVKALKRGKLSAEEIAEDFEVSIEIVVEIKNGSYSS